MAGLEKKTLNDEQFEAIVKEAVPHIEALQLVLEKRGLKNLGNITFSADGYVSFSLYDSGYELHRTDKSSEFRIKKEYGMEV